MGAVPGGRLPTCSPELGVSSPLKIGAMRLALSSNSLASYHPSEEKIPGA